MNETSRQSAAGFAKGAVWAVAIAALILIPCILNDPAAWFRRSGMLLQLLGVVTVSWGLMRREQSFGRPGGLLRFVAWARTRLFGKSAHVVAAGGLAASVSTMRGRVNIGLKPNPTLDEQVVWLTDQVARLWSEIDASYKDLDRSISKERERREKEINSVRAE